MKYILITLINVLMVGYSERTSDIVHAVISKNYEDIEIEIINNGNNLYDILTEKRFDVVITKDVDILKRIKEDGYALYVLIFADDTDKSFIINTLNNGADYFHPLDDTHTTFIILGQIIYSLARRLITENKEYARMKNEINIFSKLLPHDISSDIKFILSNISVLSMICDENEEVSGYIDIVTGVCKRMVDMLGDISSNEITDEHNFIDVIRRISKISMDTFKDIKININTKIKYGVHIMGSRLLSAVFYNLIKNSVKYAGDDCIIDIDISDVGDTIEIIISDNGPGIKKEIATEVFERGSRISGGGLGLYLSREIIQYNRGSIKLNDIERGASFKITLPIASKNR